MVGGKGTSVLHTGPQNYVQTHHSEFFSWSASLLWALMHALRKGGHKKAVEINVYMLDTEKLQENEGY